MWSLALTMHARFRPSRNFIYTQGGSECFNEELDTLCPPRSFFVHVTFTARGFHFPWGVPDLLEGCKEILHGGARFSYYIEWCKEILHRGAQSTMTLAFMHTWFDDCD